MKTRQDGGYTLVYVLVIVLLVSVMTVPLLNWLVNTGAQTRRDVASRQAFYVAQSGLTRISYYINQFNISSVKGTLPSGFQSYLTQTLPSVSALSTTLPDGTTVTDTLTVSWISQSGGIPTGCTILSKGTASMPGGGEESDTVQMQLGFRQTANPLLDPTQGSEGIIQPESNGLTSTQFQQYFISLIPGPGALSVAPFVVGHNKNPDVTDSINRFFQDPAHQSGDYVLEVTGADAVIGALHIPPTVKAVLYIDMHGTGTVTFNNVTGNKSSQFSGMILVNGNVSSQPNPALEVNNLIATGSLDWGQGKGEGSLTVHGTLAVGNGIADQHDRITMDPQSVSYPYLAAAGSTGGVPPVLSITRTQ